MCREAPTVDPVQAGHLFGPPDLAACSGYIAEVQC